MRIIVEQKLTENGEIILKTNNDIEEKREGELIKPCKGWSVPVIRSEAKKNALGIIECKAGWQNRAYWRKIE